MTSPTSSPAAGDLVLAVSFGGPGGSLAISGGFEIEWNKKATSSELATVKLTELLNAADLRLEDLARVIVNVGPGSFTGIRVGTNLARTLAYALDIPVAGVDSLRALAHRHQTTAMIALKAVRNHYYAARFDADLNPRLSPRSLTRAELDPDALVDGEGFDGILHARDVLPLAAKVQFTPWTDLHPLYVRGSEAEEKLKDSKHK